MKFVEYVGVFYDMMDRFWKIGLYFLLLEKGGFGVKGIDKVKVYCFLCMNFEVCVYNVCLLKVQCGLLFFDFMMNESVFIEVIKQEVVLCAMLLFFMFDCVFCDVEGVW